MLFFFFQAEDGIRDLVRSRGLGDVYKRQGLFDTAFGWIKEEQKTGKGQLIFIAGRESSGGAVHRLSLIHI